MVLICPKCNGRLELPPPAGGDGAICSARCGHIFHDVCLKNHWIEHRRLNKSVPIDEFKVPCPVCRLEHRPAIFDVFASTREVTFVAGEDETETADSQAMVAIRERFDSATLELEDVKTELAAQKKRFGRKTKRLRILQKRRAAKIRERDAAKKEYKDHIMGTSNNEESTLETDPESECGENVNCSIESEATQEVDPEFHDNENGSIESEATQEIDPEFDEDEIDSMESEESESNESNTSEYQESEVPEACCSIS